MFTKKFSELRKEFEDKLVEQRAQFEKRLLVLEDTIGADRSVCELKMHENCESRFCKHEENLSAISVEFCDSMEEKMERKLHEENEERNAAVRVNPAWVHASE